MSTSQLIGLITLVVGVLGVAGMKVWSWYKARPVPKAGSSSALLNSDAPAPDGVTDYLSMVEITASSATPALWWDYAKNGMTVTSILRAEVQRLTPKPAPAKQPAAPAEVKP